MTLKKFCIGTLLASLVIAALAAILIFIFGTMGEVEAKILGTSVAVCGFSLTGLCSAILYEQGRATSFAAFGMGVSLLGFAVVTGAIWELIDFSELWRAIGSIVVVVLSAAQASLLLLIRSKHSWVQGLLISTLAMVVVLALLVLYPLVLNPELNAEWYVRLIGVVAVLDALGTLMTPIVYKIKHQ